MACLILSDVVGDSLDVIASGLPPALLLSCPPHTISCDLWQGRLCRTRPPSRCEACPRRVRVRIAAQRASITCWTFSWRHLLALRSEGLLPLRAGLCGCGAQVRPAGPVITLITLMYREDWCRTIRERDA